MRLTNGETYKGYKCTIEVYTSLSLCYNLVTPTHLYDPTALTIVYCILHLGNGGRIPWSQSVALNRYDFRLIIDLWIYKYGYIPIRIKDLNRTWDRPLLHKCLKSFLKKWLKTLDRVTLDNEVISEGYVYFKIPYSVKGDMCGTHYKVNKDQVPFLFSEYINLENLSIK